MDGYSGKRVGIAGRGSGLAFKDAPSHDPSVHCNRMVCSNRIKFMKSAQVGNSDRITSSSYFRSSGKTTVATSSKAYSHVTNYRKACMGSQDRFPLRGTLSAEITTMQFKKVHTENSSTARVQVKPASKDAESCARQRSCATTQKQVLKQSGQINQETSVASSSRIFLGPRNSGQAAKTASNGQDFNANRSSALMPRANKYALRNLECASMSNVYSPPQGMVIRSSPNGDYSLAKGKSASASVSGGNSGSRKSYLAGRSLFLSDRPSQPTCTKTRYWQPKRNGVTSIRTRRKINEDGSSSTVTKPDTSTSDSEPPVVIPELLQNDVSVSESTSCLRQQSVAEHPALGQRSRVRLGGRNDSFHSNPFVHPHDGNSRQFNGLSLDQDGQQHYNGDGIAEVLLALEKIQQDEELTYEQLLILETNLFLSGFGLRDQHRDMRLDIDSMSYEELVALGEKMGTVSTGLTEEQLSNCVSKSSYWPALSNAMVGCAADDAKCSICQEEYDEGDEMGELQCGHHYHLVCIQQCLRLKNWCAICKAHATDS